MEKYIIHGGRPLRGEVDISGAKNAAVAILPATVLAGGKCVLENLPSISDVYASTQILRAMGASVRVLNRTTVEIDTSKLNTTTVPEDFSRKMRASYYFLGAFLGRFGEAAAAMPGGCDLGPRPIDQHLKAFTSLGAEEYMEKGVVHVKANRLVGSHVFFDTVSVGATINAMLASVRAEGMTVLENVAKEPHIVDVANFLNTMGADVRGAGTDVIKIRGVQKMFGGTYSIIPDQIEAGSFMVAAAITKGDVLVQNVIPKHLEPITAKLERAGAIVEEYDEAVRVKASGILRATNIKTMPHPGFPTDMQPLMTALLSVAEGTSIVTEAIWDNRFRYADELARMGANIQVDGRVAVVEGVPHLQGAPVCASDLRAGCALVMAGLAAGGITEVEEISHIERGYENLVEKLRGLGADIYSSGAPKSTLQQAF